MHTTIADLRFLDFEASSLSAQSWPIEIGLARLEGGTVVVEDRLIRPDPLWDRGDWNPQSEAIHHISRATLDAQGQPAWDVATWALGRMEGTVLVSDAPAFERHWLLRLLACQPQPLPRDLHLVDFDQVLASALTPAGLDAAYEYLSRQHKPHRAGPDAAIMAGALLRGLDVMHGRTPLRPA